jgi:hypothetical protein
MSVAVKSREIIQFSGKTSLNETLHRCPLICGVFVRRI